MVPQLNPNPLSPWLARPLPRAAPRLRLFCFPYAGIGASAFRLWPASFSPEIEVVSIQLPGRETRLREPPLTDIADAVERLVPELLPYLDVPYALFGHSMGATLAWATTVRLAASGASAPLHVILSGRRAPRVADPDPPLRMLPDALFIEEIDRRYGGIPAPVLADRELMALLLPALRADIAALETFRHAGHEPLSCPLTVFGGDQDPRAPASQLEPWRAETSGRFQLRMFPGGHFFVNTARAAVIDEVARILRAPREEAPLAATGGPR
jgi:surfactin synthase thioesterase subunit